MKRKLNTITTLILLLLIITATIGGFALKNFNSDITTYVNEAGEIVLLDRQSPLITISYFNDLQVNEGKYAALLTQDFSKVTGQKSVIPSYRSKVEIKQTVKANRSKQQTDTKLFQKVFSSDIYLEKSFKGETKSIYNGIFFFDKSALSSIKGNKDGYEFTFNKCKYQIKTDNKDFRISDEYSLLLLKQEDNKVSLELEKLCK